MLPAAACLHVGRVNARRCLPCATPRRSRRARHGAAGRQAVIRCGSPCSADRARLNAASSDNSLYNECSAAAADQLRRTFCTPTPCGLFWATKRRRAWESAAPCATPRADAEAPWPLQRRACLSPPPALVQNSRQHLSLSHTPLSRCSPSAPAAGARTVSLEAEATCACRRLLTRAAQPHARDQAPGRPCLSTQAAESLCKL